MAKIIVNANKKLGRVKEINGITNGPISMGGFFNMSEQYKDLGFPFVRLHDTDYPYPQQIDIPQIFRNFDADPYDPENYDFILTDQYITAIVETGAKIIYRLGTSIEHMKQKRFIFPPKDFEKWAIVCEHIIAHYNEGWASGFEYGIKYWEIWNEPEDWYGRRRLMWIGTAEEYYRLYDVATKHLKKRFGDRIKVGGYACTNLRGFKEDATDYYKYLLGYYHDFLAYIREHKSPLDFFSFHNYSDIPELTLECADYARRTLDEAGFDGAELVLDEWNSDFGSIAQYRKMTDMWGATYVGKMLIGLQRSPIDIATYYDGQPTMSFCGLFARDRAILKPYYTFRFFRYLRELGCEVETLCENKDISVIAASNGEKLGVMIVNIGEKTELELDFANASPKSMKVSLLDDEGDERVVAEEVLSRITLPAQSVAYIAAEEIV